MNKVSNILWGIILVAIGVIIGLNSLGIASINIFFDGWWTLFIIVPCTISLFTDHDKTGDIIGIVIGVALLLACQNIINFETIWKLMIPFVLIIFGLSIIFKDMISGNIKEEIKKLNKTNDKEYYATFSGQNLNFNDEQFDGCKLNAIFGGVKCDLKGAKIKDNVLIDACAIFGGITLYVPEDVNVKISSIPLFGGVSDERKNKQKDAKKTIYINATCMFGGVEVK